VKVIVLTGFLGSGKTTLLNRILTSQHGRRVAVIVNEFGQIGVDHRLMLSAEQQVVQMNNGCICCDVSGDLIQKLFQLLLKRSEFDVLIIEASGLATPGPIVQSLYADERIRNEFRLEGIVTVVDAKHFESQLEMTSETIEQAAIADLVLLNKVDLVEVDDLDRVERRLRTINTHAKVLRTRGSEVDLNEIFDLRIHKSPQTFGSMRASDVTDVRHLSGIETISIIESGALDGLRLSLFFRELTATMGASILRMKGVLNVWGDDSRFFFQGVQMEFEGRPGPGWGPDEARQNLLVFIGRNLDRQAIERNLKRCVVTADQGGHRLADPFGRDNFEVSPLRLDQIRYWMRQNFGFQSEVPIVIKEVPCMKPTCPPIETAIMAIVKDEPPRMFKIQRPIDEITFDHVYDLMENPMPCC
jgi:G3E family GTPase